MLGDFGNAAVALGAERLEPIAQALFSCEGFDLRHELLDAIDLPSIDERENGSLQEAELHFVIVGSHLPCLVGVDERIVVFRLIETVEDGLVRVVS